MKIYFCFSLLSVLESQRTLFNSSQGSLSFDCNQEASFSQVHETVTDSASPLSQSESDDTIILEVVQCSSDDPVHDENQSPPSKRMKVQWTDTASKQVGCKLLLT